MRPDQPTWSGWPPKPPATPSPRGGGDRPPGPLLSPGSVPGAFHVVLDGPARVQAFHLALCGSRKTGDCAGGLVVFEHPRKRG